MVFLLTSWRLVPVVTQESIETLWEEETVAMLLKLSAICPWTLKYLRLLYSVQTFLHFSQQGAGVKERHDA